MASVDRWNGLERAREKHVSTYVRKLRPEERDEFPYTWEFQGRDTQLAPESDWNLWLIMAGRGFGKTRAGAEWVRSVAERDPRARIALVAASLHEARAVMVEGESGILACSPPHRMPLYEPSLRKLTWENGAQATLFSAGEPESLRGPQHSHAWCDEVAKWDNAHGRALSAWDNLTLGLRLGEHPRIMATTTPRAVPLLKRLLDQTEEEDLALTGGRTEDNRANLSPRFLRQVRSRFGRSLLARQELNGELIADLDGALWTRSLLESCREASASAEPARIVVGVDPPASAGGDECGIVVCALGVDGIVRVLADASVRKPTTARCGA